MTFTCPLVPDVNCTKHTQFGNGIWFLSQAHMEEDGYVLLDIQELFTTKFQAWLSELGADKLDYNFCRRQFRTFRKNIRRGITGEIILEKCPCSFTGGSAILGSNTL